MYDAGPSGGVVSQRRRGAIVDGNEGRECFGGSPRAGGRQGRRCGASVGGGGHSLGDAHEAKVGRRTAPGASGAECEGGRQADGSEWRGTLRRHGVMGQERGASRSSTSYGATQVSLARRGVAVRCEGAPRGGTARSAWVGQGTGDSTGAERLQVGKRAHGRARRGPVRRAATMVRWREHDLKRGAVGARRAAGFGARQRSTGRGLAFTMNADAPAVGSWGCGEGRRRRRVGRGLVAGGGGRARGRRRAALARGRSVGACRYGQRCRGPARIPVVTGRSGGPARRRCDGAGRGASGEPSGRGGRDAAGAPPGRDAAR